MALTLAEAAKLSNDNLLIGVIETIIKESPILQRMPFVEIVGNGLTYNREATAPSAAFFDVGDTWTESTPTFTQINTQLKIMGGDADIDNFLIATRSNLQDLQASVVHLKAKAVQQLFEQTFITGDAAAALTLHACDAWSLLESSRARRQYAWAAGEKNVFGILQFLFARGGLEFSSLGASAESASLFPAYTVQPSESGLTAVQRLLAQVPDVIFVRGEFGFLKEPLATDASAYAYGTDHPLFSGLYATNLTDNRVQLFGSGLFVERFDWPGIAAAYDRLRQVHDLNLTTVAQANDRGDAILRHEAIAATGGEIVVPVNCGQELYDVIDITDAGAGLAAAKRRVLALALCYSTGATPAYEQRVALGGV